MYIIVVVVGVGRQSDGAAFRHLRQEGVGPASEEDTGECMFC